MSEPDNSDFARNCARSGGTPGQLSGLASQTLFNFRQPVKATISVNIYDSNVNQWIAKLIYYRGNRQVEVKMPPGAVRSIETTKANLASQGGIVEYCLDFEEVNEEQQQIQEGP